MWLLLSLLGSTPALAQDCVDLGVALRGVSAALDAVRLEDAHRLSSEAADGITCQTEVVNTLTLAGLYQLSGAVAYFLGDFNRAEVEFARAVAVAPASRLDPVFGEGPSSIYENIRTAALGTPNGSFTGPTEAEAWVDGRPLSPDFPLDVTAGGHLVQVRMPSGNLINTLHRVAPGERLVVTRDGAVQVKRAPRTSEASGASGGVEIQGGSGGGRRTGLMAVGGIGAVAGVAALALAAISHEQFFQATTLDEVDQYRLRTNALAAGGIGLCALGAGMLGVGVIPKKTGAEFFVTWRF